MSLGGEVIALGDAEIRVIADNGTWLIAPTLVLHYVVSHRYCPPRAFIDAVVRASFADP